MNKRSIFKWNKWFKDGWEDVKNDARLGQPSTFCVVMCSLWIFSWRTTSQCCLLRNVFNRLRACVWQNLTQDNRWILHHAPAHSVVIVMIYLQKIPSQPLIILLTHLILPRKHFPITKIQNGDESTALGRFGNNEARNNLETKKPNWKIKQDKCTAMNGEYFEGIKIDLTWILSNNI